MIEIDVVYEGDLHCRVAHRPSGATFTTDAPKDHEGQGAAFSPTDLVAAALGSCMATVMGIVARRKQMDLAGARVHVVKEMSATPPRRIAALASTITLPARLTQDERTLLERTALTCSVHQSLHPDIHAPVRFVYQ